jgi:hypothetical protein
LAGTAFWANAALVASAAATAVEPHINFMIIPCSEFPSAVILPAPFPRRKSTRRIDTVSAK